MHYLRTRLRPSVHGAVGRSGTGSSPRCVQPRRRRVMCVFWLICSAWHLVTTENFTVPLHDLYNSSFNGQALHRSVAAFPIYAMTGMLSHYCPVPSTPPIAHVIH